MRDFYLDNKNVFNRLKEEYIKYGKLIIAYDFDDTVYDYHKKGYSYECIINLLRKWKKHAHFVVFTASEENRYFNIIKYLEDNNIPFDTINENIPDLDLPKAKNKVYYNALIDDRAGMSTIYDLLNILIDQILDGTIKSAVHKNNKDFKIYQSDVLIPKGPRLHLSENSVIDHNGNTIDKRVVKNDEIDSMIYALKIIHDYINERREM